MKKKDKLSRRNFLEKSLLSLTVPSALSPFQRFLGFQLLSGGLSKAYAQSLSTTPRRFVSFMQQGAPARWMYDLFLTPYQTNNYIQNPMVGTCFSSSSGRYDGIHYQTTSIKGINAPMMWSFNVPQAGGGQRPMSDLLNNLLCIQGISTDNAGHPGSQSLHYRPSGSHQSISALNTDIQSGPLEAISTVSKNFVYQSNGKSNVNRLKNSGNLIEQLMLPFASGMNNSTNTQKQLIGDLIDAIDSDVEDYFIDMYKRSSPQVASRTSARSVANSGSINYNSTWNNLISKYQDLIDRAVSPSDSFIGFNDLPIGTTGSRDLRYRLGPATDNIVSNPDIRDLFSNGVNANGLASSFAMAEYLLKNNLSYSIALSGGNLTRIKTSGNSVATTNFDEHSVGGMMAMIVNFYVFRALSACLLELIEQLKSDSLFDETVIEVLGEFNRSPRADLSGSDHGWQGKSVAYYSGALNGPVILGELTNSPNPTYPGSWGWGAANSSLGGPLTIPMATSTLAGLLRTPIPFTAAISPLATVSSTGVLTENIPRTRIVT